MTMKTTVVLLAILCVPFLTGSLAAQSTPADAARQVCSADVPQDLNNDQMRWRLRAYQNLDCLMARLEQAMNRPQANQDQVQLTREEAEQLLDLAWRAKDAAQRSGN
jgi:hypothetical protein